MLCSKLDKKVTLNIEIFKKFHIRDFSIRAIYYNLFIKYRIFFKLKFYKQPKFVTERDRIYKATYNTKKI